VLVLQLAVSPVMAVQSLSMQHAEGSMQSVPQGLVELEQLYEQVLVEVSHLPVCPPCMGQSLSVQQPETHLLPHFFCEVSVQVKSQFLPSQVAMDPVGWSQATQRLPQCMIELSATQVPPQMWLPPSHSLMTKASWPPSTAGRSGDRSACTSWPASWGAVGRSTPPSWPASGCCR
jgi:hypothetical protein